MDKKGLEAFIKKHKQNEVKSISFVTYLYQLMDVRAIDKQSDIYNKAGISRQLWSSIISEKSKPSLNVCLKIVFALKLTNAECKLLLKKAGFTLASSSTYSLIIRYALETENYNLEEVNDMLSEYGYENSLIY